MRQAPDANYPALYRKSRGRYSCGMTDSAPCARIDGDTIRISAFGGDWILRSPADLDELWDAMGADDFEDERIPYWTEFWPASLVLAEWLYMRRDEIRGRLCLDLGCGLGFTAIVGAWLGCQTVACDYESASLLAARENAALNAVRQPAWIAADWRMPVFAERSIDYIWAGDILYEKRALVPVLDFIASCLKPEGKAWIAEPGRAIFGGFPDICENSGFAIKKVFGRQTGAVRPQQARINAAVWEVRRKSRKWTKFQG